MSRPVAALACSAIKLLYSFQSTKLGATRMAATRATMIPPKPHRTFFNLFLRAFGTPSMIPEAALGWVMKFEKNEFGESVYYT